MIDAKVQGQSLLIVQPVIADDTIDYLTMHFRFSEDWDGCQKWVHFQKDDEIYDILLEDDEVKPEMHLNLGKGRWKVYLHGNLFEDGIVKMRITTEQQVIVVVKTGTLNGEPFSEFPASAIEQLNAKVDEVNSKALKLQDDTLIFE